MREPGLRESLLQLHIAQPSYSSSPEDLQVGPVDLSEFYCCRPMVESRERRVRGGELKRDIRDAARTC